MREVSKLRGWVQLCCGLFLIGLMGTITWKMLPTLMRPGEWIDGTTFSGTAEQAQLILALFGLVIAVGVAAAASGAYILATGRQNRTLAGIAIGLASLLLAIAYFVKRVLA